MRSGEGWIPLIVTLWPIGNSKNAFGFVHNKTVSRKEVKLVEGGQNVHHQKNWLSKCRLNRQKRNQVDEKCHPQIVERFCSIF